MRRLVIGDIHGHAKALEKLLDELGYSTDGETRPSGRKIIFLGDFIDRGTENKSVITIVRDLMEKGIAEAVMGNHEYNAICYHTEHHTETGEYLREHSDKNTGQHEEFLKEYQDAEELYETIEWFKTLPLFLEKDGIRIVHACWDQRVIDKLKDELGPTHRLNENFLIASSNKGTPEYEAIERILKGPEHPLPGGITFIDKDNHERSNVRIKWWKRDTDNLRNLSSLDEEDRNKVPEKSVSLDYIYPDGAAPVFFGHYWMRHGGETVQQNSACLDYSIAQKGHLACYRYDVTSFPQTLLKSNVVYVS